jgi:hypothetical protein
MIRLFTSLQASLVRLWNTDRLLTATGLLMSAALLVFGAAMLLDPRTILGAPAWLKPAKFAVSTAIYSFTLAWMFTFLPAWRRTRSIVGRTTAIVFIGEVGIIAMQAWRGTTSHFNVSTPLDGMLFGVMGAAIVVQTLTSIAVAVALWREPIAVRALGTALRAGMIIAILGASIAGAMTRPTGIQIAEMRSTGRVANIGAHTVGAVDGGSGLPVTGWSRDHGDLRIAHFVGLHALQVLPIVALVLHRRRTGEREAVRTMRIVAASYAALVAILLLQALRAEPLFRPEGATIVLFGTWAVVSATALWMTRRNKQPSVSAQTFAGARS